MAKKEIPILYEDDFLFAVNKPPRVATVPGGDVKPQHSLLGMVQEIFKDKEYKPYVLHRLDAQTSGVLLFGKYERDRAKLESIFQHAETGKKYIALVRGVPHGNLITSKLESRTGGEKIPATTKYKVVKTFKDSRSGVPPCALVEAVIETGRKHQIRQHFAIIGHPIILDDRYGDIQFNRKFRIRFRLGRLFLHAAEISFVHPLLNKKVNITAAMPIDLKVVMKRLS